MSRAASFMGLIGCTLNWPAQVARLIPNPMNDSLTFSDLVNSRQVALGLWLLVFAGWALTHGNIRTSIRDVWGHLLQWKVGLMLVSMSMYVGAAVWALAQIGAWRVHQIVDTALWLVLSAAVLLFDVVTHQGSERIFPRVVAHSFLVVVIVEFLVAFGTFPLLVELLFILFLFFLGAMLAIAERKSVHQAVHRFLVGVQGVVGFAILIAAVAKVARGWSTFASIDTVRDVIMAPALSLAFIPFLWFASTVTLYEDLFLRHSFGPDKSFLTRAWFVLRMVAYCLGSRRKISGIQGRFPLEIMHAVDRKSIRELIHHDKIARRRQKADGAGAA